MSYSRGAVAVLVSAFLVVAMISGQATEVPRSKASPNAAQVRDGKGAGNEKGIGDSKAVRIREGSKLVDQIGDFQKSGDQINFYTKEPQGAFRVLENLALERVVRVLDDNPSMRLWSVTGVITEFRGENYLLVTRATMKAQPKSTPTVERRKVESADKKEE